LDIVIRLESVNQGTVRGKNDRDFATYTDTSVSGIIDQARHEGMKGGKETGPVAMRPTFFCCDD
jgi:hypothetical protein